MKRFWRRSAFTLVEVLLATLLAAMLLAALWSMLSMYSKVFEGGYARTEQAQLARTLLEQLAVDLQSVQETPRGDTSTMKYVQLGKPAPGLEAESGAADTSAASSSRVGTSLNASNTKGTTRGGSSSTSSSASRSGTSGSLTAPAGSNDGLGGSATSGAGAAGSGISGDTAVATRSLRPAGLFGTDTFLQLDVWQPVMAAAEFEVDETGLPGESVHSHVEELKTVTYSFEELSNPAQPSEESIIYLLRRELSWEQAHPGKDGPATGKTRPSDSLADTTSDANSASESTSKEAFDVEQLKEDPNTTVVPEVISFALRYFDGSVWSEEWDSVAREGLPTAVEVTMQFRSPDEPEADLDAAVEAGANYEKLMRAKHPEYRLLIPIAAAVPSQRGSTEADPYESVPSPSAPDSYGKEGPANAFGIE